jgi:mannose-6-phosphate isomerase-like protein (cupin superfamily)
MQTKLTGLSIASIDDPIETYQQLGGPGRVFNKALAIPCHLGHPWHSVEFVLLPPGHHGVGSHQQTTDEIYFILSGQGALVTNGESALVETGTLVCAPAGTIHSLTNTSATKPLTLLVVELAPPEGSMELPRTRVPSFQPGTGTSRCRR